MRCLSRELHREELSDDCMHFHDRICSRSGTNLCAELGEHFCDFHKGLEYYRGANRRLLDLAGTTTLEIFCNRGRIRRPYPRNLCKLVPDIKIIRSTSAESSRIRFSCFGRPCRHRDGPTEVIMSADTHGDYPLKWQNDIWQLHREGDRAAYQKTVEEAPSVARWYLDGRRYQRNGPDIIETQINRRRSEVYYPTTACCGRR